MIIEKDRDVFRNIARKAKEKGNIKLLMWCVKMNHKHLQKIM
jgi:REP element-mobilizing transposase RayT